VRCPLRRPSPSFALRNIKLLHTLVWAFFVACIVAIPIAAIERRLFLSAILSVLVWLECAVLAVNRGRCPLTDIARNYTSEKSDNFDIYLPEWLARYNKAIFGSLFVCGESILIIVWLNP